MICSQLLLSSLAVQLQDACNHETDPVIKIKGEEKRIGIYYFHEDMEGLTYASSNRWTKMEVDSSTCFKLETSVDGKSNMQ